MESTNKNLVLVGFGVVICTALLVLVFYNIGQSVSGALSTATDKEQKNSELANNSDEAASKLNQLNRIDSIEFIYKFYGFTGEHITASLKRRGGQFVVEYISSRDPDKPPSGKKEIASIPVTLIEEATQKLASVELIFSHGHTTPVSIAFPSISLLNAKHGRYEPVNTETDNYPSWALIIKGNVDVTFASSSQKMEPWGVLIDDYLFTTSSMEVGKFLGLLQEKTGFDFSAGGSLKRLRPGNHDEIH
jgi:hypothetical protein